MLDTLWQVFLGSLIALAIALVWLVIVALVIASIKHLYNPEYNKMKARHEKHLARIEERLEK